MALALRPSGARVWVVLGDGECQEGQVWEAAMLAAQCQLPNLVAVIDANRHQEWGWNRAPGAPAPEPVARLGDKWAAFGWQVIECDGHDHAALSGAYERAVAAAAPSVVLAHTQKGKGYPLLESDPIRFHCASLSDVEHAQLVGSGS
jgi:transketolase